MKYLRRFLLFIYVLQVVSNQDRNKAGLKRLGKGYMEARRLNPYNPLSYILLLIFLVVGLFAFGFVGIWKEIDTENPFKWS